MENLEFLKEFAQSVTSIWSFLTFLTLVILFVFIFLYKKDKNIFNKIIDKLPGKKSNVKLDDICKNIELLKNSNDLRDKAEKNRREIIMKEIKKINENNNLNYEKNKEQHKILFLKIEKLDSNTKINFYINNHNKLINTCFDDFCLKNQGISKNLIDIFQQGIDKNKLFFFDMILIGLENISMPVMTEKLKSMFRTLRNSPLYTTLGLEKKDLKDFKIYIKEKITKPLIDELVDELRAQKASGKVNGELILEFSKMNLALINGMLINVKNYFEKI